MSGSDARNLGELNPLQVSTTKRANSTHGEVRPSKQPVVQVRLHSAGDASPLHPTAHRTRGGAGCVAPPSNTPGILSRRALPARGPHGAWFAPWGGAGRLAALGATPDSHHGLRRGDYRGGSRSQGYKFVATSAIRLDLDSSSPRSNVDAGLRYFIVPKGKASPRPRLKVRLARSIRDDVTLPRGRLRHTWH
jgi:hypothetical protein